MQNATRSNQAAIRTRAQRCIVLLVALSLAGGSSSSASFQRSKSACSPGALRPVVTYHVPLCRPLVSLDVVSSVLNVSRESARGLIEDGSLLWAFDVAVKQSRPLIRVLAESLADYASARTAPKTCPDFEAVLNAIFPGHGKTIRASQLCRVLSVDEDHGLNLWRAGHLRLANGAQVRLGCNGSPSLDFESVREFLRERQMI